jgi:hypothetical protein
MHPHTTRVASDQVVKDCAAIGRTPLLLLEGKTWAQPHHAQDARLAGRLMAMARDQGLMTLDQIHTATLERNGEISIVPQEAS